MAWIHLVTAIVMEVCGTVCMKMSRGFEELGPGLAIFVFYTVSLYFLTRAIAVIDISVAYAVWSGLGTALVAGIGVLWFRETMTAVKAFSLVLIIIGVVGLQLTESH